MNPLDADHAPLIRGYGDDPYSHEAGHMQTIVDDDYPSSDCGHNVFFATVLFPLNVLAFPVRALFAIMRYEDENE